MLTAYLVLSMFYAVSLQGRYGEIYRASISAYVSTPKSDRSKAVHGALGMPPDQLANFAATRTKIIRDINTSSMIVGLGLVLLSFYEFVLVGTIRRDKDGAS